MRTALALIVAFSLTASAGELLFEVSFSGAPLVSRGEEGYVRLDVDGLQSWGMPGEPMLPVRPVALVLPSGATGASVSVIEGEFETVPLSGTLQPVPVPRPFSAILSRRQEIREDPSIYLSDGTWPVLPVVNQRTGCKSGYTLFSFLVYPARYEPTNRSIQYAKTMTLRVTWDEGTPRSVTEEQFLNASRQLEGWIDNPEMLSTWGPVSRGRDEIDLLIITTDDYSDSFTAFTAFKTTQGYQTEMAFVDDILASTPGYDDAEKLRNYIIERYSAEGLEYVLLAGDQTMVPARNVNLYCEGYGDNAPADLYYSDLDGTWDASGDHDYGQPDDDLDLYSDVAVGRALFDTQEEAALFVQHTIMYETAPPPGDWRTTAMLCGAGLFTGYTGAKVCDSIAVNLPAGWQVTKAYEELSTTDGFTTHIDVINDGTNWVHYAGHGNTAGIYWQGSPSSMMTNSIAQGLTNGNMIGIHHSIACHPGAFQSGQCCAEALWHNPGGGAVSVMFNTSYGWEGNVPEMGISEWMCVYVTEEIFQLGNTLIGNAFAASKDRRVPLWSGGFDRELYCLMDWHGFHDPTLVPAGEVTGNWDTQTTVVQESGLALGRPGANPAAAGSILAFPVTVGAAPAELTVYDISGRAVWRSPAATDGELVWDTGSTAAAVPGLYFARLTDGTSSSVQQVILTR